MSSAIANVENSLSDISQLRLTERFQTRTSGLHSTAFSMFLINSSSVILNRGATGTSTILHPSIEESLFY